MSSDVSLQGLDATFKTDLTLKQKLSNFGFKAANLGIILGAVAATVGLVALVVFVILVARDPQSFGLFVYNLKFSNVLIISLEMEKALGGIKILAAIAGIMLGGSVLTGASGAARSLISFTKP